MDILEYTQHFIFGDTCYPMGGRYGPLKKANLDLFILLDGECTIQSDNSAKQYSAGDAGLTFSSESLTITYKSGINSRMIWCQTVDLALDEKAREKLQTLPCKFKPSGDLRTLLTMGANLERNTNVERFKNSIGETAFNEFLYIAKYSESEGLYPYLVNKTKVYIDNHYCEPCNLDKIAAAAGVNKKYLSRLFKQHLGVTPLKYLWDKREAHALELLLNTSIPVAELAYQSGFKNPYHFSNFIKKKHGKYPSEIRKSHEDRELLPEEKNAALIKTF